MAGTPNGAGPSGSIASAIADGTPLAPEDFSQPESTEPTGEPSGTSETSPAQKALDAEGVRKMLDDQLGPLKDKLAETAQENALLRGMVQGARANVSPTAPSGPATPAQKRQRFLETKPREELLKDLQNQPFETLNAYVSDQIQEAVAPLTEAIQKLTGNITQQQQSTAFERQAQADVTKLNSKYGHLKDHAEFRPLADRIYNEQLAANGNQYRPGMLSEAAADALAQLVQEGKLNNAGPAKAVPQMRASFNGSTHGPIAQGRGDDSGNGAGEGNTLSSLGFDDVNVRAARKVMAKFGLTEADYVRQIKGQLTVDGNYGGLNRG